ncbi:MAG: Uma2 family endonuclease [Myxococcota bacterium]
MTSGALRHRYSLAEYLEVEEMSAVRHEYFAGGIYAMAGGTPEHSALSGSIIAALVGQLRGRPCRVHSADLRLRILATGLATYADAAVVWAPEAYDPESPTHVTNPVLVVEVLSPSTQDYDLGDKRRHYQRIESLEAYLCVAQDRRRFELWTRDGETWRHQSLGAGDIARLPRACTLVVDDVYADARVDVD